MRRTREIGQCAKGVGIAGYGGPNCKGRDENAGGGRFLSVTGLIPRVVDEVAILVEHARICRVCRVCENRGARCLLNPGLNRVIASHSVQEQARDVDIDRLVVLDRGAEYGVVVDDVGDKHGCVVQSLAEGLGLFRFAAQLKQPERVQQPKAANADAAENIEKPEIDVERCVARHCGGQAMQHLCTGFDVGGEVVVRDGVMQRDQTLHRLPEMWRLLWLVREMFLDQRPTDEHRAFTA